MVVVVVVIVVVVGGVVTVVVVVVVGGVVKVVVVVVVVGGVVVVVVVVAVAVAVVVVVVAGVNVVVGPAAAAVLLSLLASFQSTVRPDSLSQQQERQEFQGEDKNHVKTRALVQLRRRTLRCRYSHGRLMPPSCIPRGLPVAELFVASTAIASFSTGSNQRSAEICIGRFSARV